MAEHFNGRHEFNKLTDEHSLLVSAGFDPTEEGDLCHKDGVWYGRGAALQYAWQEWREHGRSESSNPPTRGL
jgi:hypothetical protein